MNKMSIISMKIVRCLVNKISNWYRYTSFIAGLKSYEENINVRGPVYLWNDNVEIGINTTIYASEKIRIGSDTLIAGACYIIDSNHGTEREMLVRNQSSICKGPVIIGEDVWLGAGIKVLSGVQIGKGAVIGAQALANKNIPPYAIAVGVPAEIIGYRK